MAVGRRDAGRALQKVLGQGGNVNAANPLEVHDPKVGSLISYEGETTADGAADGSTLIDNVLTTRPDYNGNLVIITSGAYFGQARDIDGVTTAGTVTPHLVFGGQILIGTTFVIAAIRLTPVEVAALTALVVLLMADVGDASAATLGSIFGILGDPAATFTAQIAAIQADIGDPTGETLPSLAVKFGDIARSLDLTIGARWDGAGDLGTDITAILAALVGATSQFNEQADAVINQAVTAAEVFIITMTAATTRYILRDLRLKSADPTIANTITVRLYTLINDVEVNVDSFIITNANFGTYFSLMDMFGVPYVAGDSIRVSLQGSAAGPYTVTGQYSHGKTNV